jgi:ABC-type Fe3+ transport system permease subunit
MTVCTNSGGHESHHPHEARSVRSATVSAVSDTPPPPPPPPPDLSPPGAPPPVSAGDLKRVGGLVAALTITTLVVGVGSLGTTLVQGAARTEARAFLAEEITEDEFLESFLPSAGLGLVTSAVQLAVVVLTIVLMVRLARNLRAIGRDTTWGPAWGIGAWFLPPLVLYLLPYLMFRELWKASDPTSPPGDQRWRTASVSPVVTLWWVLFGLVPIGLLVVQGVNSVGAGFTAGSTEAIAKQIAERYWLSLIGALATLASAIAYVLMVRRLGARHRLLTGESARG